MDNLAAFSELFLSISERTAGECCVSCRSTDFPSTSCLREGDGEGQGDAGAVVAIVNCCWKALGKQGSLCSSEDLFAADLFALKDFSGLADVML